MRLSKSAFGMLLVLSLFGIYAASIFGHEFFHVLHGKGAESVCVDLNLKIEDRVQQGYMTAHTSFDVSKYGSMEEFYTFRELSEKYAGVVQHVLMVTLAFLLAAAIMRRPRPKKEDIVVRPTQAPCKRPPAIHDLPQLTDDLHPRSRWQLPKL